jgi:O-antigen/teichoic acid export membrane protein
VAVATREASADMRLVARAGSLGLIGVAVSGAMQFLLVLVVSRALSARGAGTFMEAVALFTIVSNVTMLGANTGLVRSIPRLRAHQRMTDVRRTLAAAFVPVLGLSTVAAVAMYGLAPQLTSVFFRGAHPANAVAYVHIFALVLPLAALTMLMLSASRGLGTMVPYVCVQNVGLPVARLAFVSAVVVVGLHSIAVALAWALPAALAFAAAVGALIAGLRRAARHEPGGAKAPRPTRALAHEFWRFSGPRGVASVLGICVTWSDVLLVGALRSTREAGIYAAASRISIVGAYALQAVGMAIGPRISGLLARGRPERVETVYRTATWWLMALLWPLYLSLAAFAPLVMAAFGHQFASGQTALVILAAAMLVNLATGNVTVVLLMGGKSSWNMINALVSLLLNVSLNLLLIPRLGMSGAALAWAVSIVFVNLAPLVQVRVFMGLNPPFGAGYVVVALAAASCYGALGVVVRLVLGTSPETFALFLAGATLIYTAVLWRFRDTLQLGELRDALAIPNRTIPTGRRLRAAGSRGHH